MHRLDQFDDPANAGDGQPVDPAKIGSVYPELLDHDQVIVIQASARVSEHDLTFLMTVAEPDPRISSGWRAVDVRQDDFAASAYRIYTSGNVMS